MSRVLQGRIKRYSKGEYSVTINNAISNLSHFSWTIDTYMTLYKKQTFCNCDFSSKHLLFGWMDWMKTCEFSFFSKVFQSYKDTGRGVRKGSVQWNRINDWNDFFVQGVSNPGPLGLWPVLNLPIFFFNFSIHIHINIKINAYSSMLPAVFQNGTTFAISCLFVFLTTKLFQNGVSSKKKEFVPMEQILTFKGRSPTKSETSKTQMIK